MKLKTLVGSLVMAGVVSTSVYAAPKATSTSAQISSLNQRIQKLEAIINRNQDNAANNPAALSNPNWFQNVVISGEFEPTFNWSNRSFQYSKLTSSTVRSNGSGSSSAFIRNAAPTQAYLNAAELYLDAQVNSMTDLHTALDYDYDPSVYGTGTSSSFTPNKQSMFFSEADVRFSNLAKSGLYSVIGKQYFNFGSYQHDTLTTPFTEMLSKTNAIGATVGYLTNNGFNADGYLLDGAMSLRNSYAQTSNNMYVASPRFQTWGASAGYNMQNQRFGINAQVDFLSNMAQTIYLSHTMVENNATGSDITNTYYSTVPAVSAHLGLTSGAFGLMFDYVTALKRFANTDLTTNYAAGSTAIGAKPAATNAQFNYNNMMMGHANTMYVGHQTSSDSEAIYGQDMGGYYIPQSRFDIGDKYTIAQNVLVNLEYDHDQDYDHQATDTNAGSSRSSNALFAGLDVKF